MTGPKERACNVAVGDIMGTVRHVKQTQERRFWEEVSTACKMREVPSELAGRGRLQTTLSCVG